MDTKKTFIAICIINALVIFYLAFHKKELKIETDRGKMTQYVGRVKMNDVSIRLLVLKHCFEQMANDDARLAIQAVNLAAGKGLTIKDIGEFNIGPQGKIDRRVGLMLYPEQLKNFVSEQMKINAKAGDTLVIFTIGHGMPSGQLDTLGPRKEIMEALAVAAEENNQETVWWQLSCYASARLPRIAELTEKQQGLFTVVASSDAHTESPSNVEGRIMEKVFVAMAENSPKIDPDHNNIVIAEELANFLNTVSRNRGNLVYAKSPQEPVFGLSSEARLYPIIDRNNDQREYPYDYIPIPQ